MKNCKVDISLHVLAEDEQQALVRVSQRLRAIVRGEEEISRGDGEAISVILSAPEEGKTNVEP